MADENEPVAPERPGANPPPAAPAAPEENQDAAAPAPEAESLVAPNTPAVLTGPLTTLGIDTATALSTRPDRWRQVFDEWRKARKGDKSDGVPEFAGRYFGWANRWAPGEVQALRRGVPSAQSLRYIFALNQPPQENTEKGPNLGRKDAAAAGKAIEAALSQKKPASSLLPPAAGKLLVFLCLDYTPLKESLLSREYWMAWSETLRSYGAGTELLPALYCPIWDTIISDGSSRFRQNRSVKAVFDPSGAPKDWETAQHRCYALATPSRGSKEYSRKISSSAQNIAGSWPDFEELDQPDGVTAPVVLWQYWINLVLAAELAPWQQKGTGPAISSEGTPNGRYSLLVKISKGGALGEAEFQYALATGSKLSKPQPATGRFQIPRSGVTLIFPGGTYAAGTEYRTTALIGLRNGNLPTTGFVHDVDLEATAPNGYEGRPVTDYMLQVPEEPAV